LTKRRGRIKTRSYVLVVVEVVLDVVVVVDATE